MSAQPHDPASQPIPERTPRAVRAALPASDHAFFDRDFKAAMAKATDELDLSHVFSCIDHWRHIAYLKASGRHDEIMRRAEEIQQLADRGQLPPARPWREVVKARADELGVEIDL